MRRYLRSGYIQTAIGLLAGIAGPAVGRLMDGKPAIDGPYTAALCAVLLILCLVLLFIGIRNTMQES
jgi:hypothetical protein